MNILVVNQNTDNFGDDIAAYAFATNIFENFPNAKIRFIYKPSPWHGKVPIESPNVEHFQHPNFTRIFYYHLMQYIFRSMLGCAVQVPQNSQLNMLYTYAKWADLVFFSPSGANIGIYKDWFTLKTLIALVAFRKKPIFHLCTIGLSGNRLFDTISTYFLKKCRVFVREKKCQEELATVAIPSTLGPDTAFILERCLTKKSSAALFYKIGIILTDINWHPKHKVKNLIKNVMLEIVDSIHQISDQFSIDIDLFPHLYGHLDEHQKIIEFSNLLANLPKPPVVKIHHFDSAIEYDNAIANCSLVISMRYHGCVLSAKNGIPFISISYEEKMNELCRYTNMSDFCIDVEQL